MCLWSCFIFGQVFYVVPKERGRALSPLNDVKPASCVPRQCGSLYLLLALLVLDVRCVYVREAWTWRGFGDGDLSLTTLYLRVRAHERLSGGSKPEMARLVSLSASSMSRGARNPSQHASKPARFSWVSSLSGTFLWEGPRWWWGALVPARWYSAGAEQSQDETLLCSPLHISGFLCLCLDFQPLNWASAVKGLQPRGQGYCLFLWLSSRATQTGRRTDINIAFVTLWMLLLLPWAISYSLLSDFSSFSNRYTPSLSRKGGKRLEKGWQNPFVLHGLMLAGCCCSLFSSFCRSGGAAAAVGITQSSGNASQLLRQGWKFFPGKRRRELCVFSLLSREFIMKFIRWDLWLC